jgi:lanosterol synthase
MILSESFVLDVILIIDGLKKLSRAMERAIKFLHKAQTPDGGWIGSWGICITYATQFALESLSLVGETYETSPRSRRACEFLLQKQREDGGWGESYEVCTHPGFYLDVTWRVSLLSSKTCALGTWVEHEKTQIVQTCWAVMSLMHAKYPYPEPIRKGVQMVMSRQRPVSFFLFT